MIHTHAFTLEGQLAWFHDEGVLSGYFHTYDALAVGGPGDVPRKVHVFLPRRYEHSGERFPVLYMNDGNTAFFPGGAGGKSWDVARALRELYADPAFPRLIVVAVHPLLRAREYTHAEWGPSRPSSGVEAYTSYIADHVKGFIDAAYRTQPGPESTVIAGSSHGGLASFYMATRRPDRFGAALCMSPSFWAGIDPVHGGDYAGGPLSSSPLVEPVKETLANPALRPRLWIDWGLVHTGGDHNEKIEVAACRRGREMVDLLQRSFGYEVGRELFVAEDPEGEHDEIAWGRRFPSALRSLFTTRSQRTFELG